MIGESVDAESIIQNLTGQTNILEITVYDYMNMIKEKQNFLKSQLILHGLKHSTELL